MKRSTTPNNKNSLSRSRSTAKKSASRAPSLPSPPLFPSDFFTSQLVWNYDGKLSYTHLELAFRGVSDEQREGSQNKATKVYKH